MSNTSSLFLSSEEIPAEDMSVAELIQRSKTGLMSRDATLVRAYLKQLRKKLQDPEKLKPVLHSEFRAFLQMSLSSNLDAVPAEAITLLTGTLEALGHVENSEQNAGLIKVLLRFIKLDAIAVPSSPDVLVIAFDALNRWSCLGLKRARMLLEIFSIDFLDEIQVREYPMNVTVSYISLIASLARHANVHPDLLPMVLRIFAKTLGHQGLDDTCEIAQIICAALTSISENSAFGGRAIDEVLDSRLVSGLVRHVITLPTCIFPGVCVRKCLSAMMKMLVNFTVWSLEQCQRFVDQGILLAIEKSLSGGNPESIRFTCMTLTNVFAYCPYSIEYAMHSTIAERLFLLREASDAAIRKEALRASSNFISRASWAQIFSMVKIGYVPEITKLLRSQHPDVVCHGLQALLAFIGAANFTNPSKLPAIHELLSKQSVSQLTDALRAHKVKDVRLAAITVHKFMTSYHDEKKFVSGARPKWSGMSKDLSPSSTESVMSLPI